MLQPYVLMNQKGNNTYKGHPESKFLMTIKTKHSYLEAFIETNTAIFRLLLDIKTTVILTPVIP